MEGLLTRGRERTFPGCGGTAALARGPTLACVDSRNPSQSAIGQWDWGLPTLWGGIEPGDFSVRPRVVELQRYGKLPDGWMGTYPPQVGRDRGFGPKGNTYSALAPEAPANQQSASGTGISTPYGAVLT